MIVQFDEAKDVGAYSFPANTPIDTSLLPEGPEFGQKLIDDFGAVEVHAKPVKGKKDKVEEK